MARVSYNLLPVEGPKFPRDISRIVNQSMTGQQNCVLDIEIPAGGFDDGSFRVEDIRVSQQKWIDFVPTDLAAILLADDLFISEIGNGFFDVSVVPQEFQGSAVQVRGSGIGPNLSTQAVIPFQSIDFNINYTAVADPTNTITVLTNGIQNISFTLSGAYDVGTDYNFGVNVVSGPSAPGSFLVATSTSNQNDTVSVSGNILAQLVDGDVLEFVGNATSINILSPYDLVWSMTSEGAFPLQPGAGPFNMRALIIG